jgi:hypothetical protein
LENLIMKTTKQNHRSSSKPAVVVRDETVSTYTTVIQNLQTVEAGLDLVADVGSKKRETVRRKLRRLSDPVLQGVATLAETNGGALAGITVNPTDVRTVVTRFTTSETLVRALRNFATRVDNDAVVRKGEVAEQVAAILSALSGYVKTPAGAQFTAPLRDLRALMRTKRSKAAATPQPSAPVAPKGGATTLETEDREGARRLVPRGTGRWRFVCAGRASSGT